MRRDVKSSTVLGPAHEPPVDLGDDQIAVAGFRRAAADQHQTFAISDAIRQRLGRRRHRAVISQIGLILCAIALKDLRSRLRIAMIVKHERIAKHRVAAVDVECGFAGDPERLFPRRKELDLRI